MASNDPFGFDPDDLNRMLQGALGQFGRLLDGSDDRSGLSALFAQNTRRTGSGLERETTGDTGDGVWAIYTVDLRGGAQVEQIFAAELDALRANKHNTESNRKVRFLPYGIAVSVLDEPEIISDSQEG